MALVTAANIKLRLDQLADTSEHDTLLTAICTEIEDVITLYLGFTFGEYTDETDVVVFGSGTPWLNLPPHSIGTVTTVTLTGGTTEITGWTEQADGSLYLDNYHPYNGGWNNTRFTVTGDFGYGDAPDSIKKVAIEMACAAFRERDKAYSSDVIGVEGAGGMAVGYKGALLKQHKMILDLTKRKYLGLQIA